MIWIDYVSVIVVVLVCGGTVAFVMGRLPKKEVLHLRPRDKRGESLTISDETDLGLICKKKRGGGVNRYIKRGSGWVFNEAGRMVTRFFGIEGSAYTAYAKEGNEITDITIPQYLRFLWTDKFYEMVPAEKRRAIESDVIGMTIAPKAVNYEAEDLPHLTTDMINDEDDSRMLQKFVESNQPKTSADMMRLIFAALLGAFAMYFIVKQGYL